MPDTTPAPNGDNAPLAPSESTTPPTASAPLAPEAAATDQSTGTPGAERAAVGDTAGTGTVIALGCIGGTLFLIVLGLLYFLVTQVFG